MPHLLPIGKKYQYRYLVSVQNSETYIHNVNTENVVNFENVNLESLIN